MGINQTDFLMAVSLDLITRNDLILFVRLQDVAEKVWSSKSRPYKRLEIIINLIGDLEVNECLVRTEESKLFVMAEYKVFPYGC